MDNIGQAGQEREYSYCLMFANMPSAFCFNKAVFDSAGAAVDFIILDINKAFTEMTGLARSAVLGKLAAGILAGEKKADLEFWFTLYSQVAETGKAVHYERYSAVLKRWCAFTAFSPHPGYFAVVANDITRRREAEAKLSRQNKYLLALQETSLALVNRLNLDDLLEAVVAKAGALVGTSHGFLYLVNTETQSLELKVRTGLHSPVVFRELKMGQGFSGRVWAAGRPLVIADYSIWKHRLNDPLLDFIRSLVGIPLRLGDQVIGVLGLSRTEKDHTFSSEEINILSRLADLAAIAIDNARLFDGAQLELAERKRVESELRQSEERYRLLFNSTIDAVFVWELANDGTPGCFMEVNDIACQRLGYTKEELLKLTPVNVQASPDNFAQLIKKLINNRHVLAEIEHLAKDGRIIPVESNVHLFNFNNRQMVVSVARDISERKLMEEEMARLDRLGLIGSMAASIGHEVRNPMTTVRGFLQILQNKPDCSRYRDYFDMMIEELDRANYIITEFLTLAKTKAVDRQLKNLNAVIQSVLPLLRAEAGAGGKTVAAALDEQAPEILLDEKEIRQLILNLARNGLEATPPNRSLTVRTYCRDNKVVLAVEDQGKGIEPQVLKKLGMPFFSTKENATGLGLAICYSIAARHDASIKIDTGPGGSVFSVFFSVPAGLGGDKPGQIEKGY